MRKQSENQPIDDLFARKLGNMSLPPSPDGFERLQARMGQNKPEVRIIFWRNPAMHRYIAAAACLLLVCLFGWLYWPSPTTESSVGQQMATNEKNSSHPKLPTQHQSNKLTENLNPNATPSGRPTEETIVAQLTDVSKPPAKKPERSRLENQPVEAEKTSDNVLSPETNEQPIAAQTKPIGGKTNQEAPIVDAPATAPTPERLAEKTVKPTPAAERVLIVTIAEPQALIAARQAAATPVDENATVALTENSQKEAKTGGLWNQIKRIKQGEVFAQRSRADDERGLIGRAYSGLKQSLDKDKSTKQ